MCYPHFNQELCPKAWMSSWILQKINSDFHCFAQTANIRYWFWVASWFIAWEVTWFEFWSRIKIRFLVPFFFYNKQGLFDWKVLVQLIFRQACTLILVNTKSNFIVDKAIYIHHFCVWHKLWWHSKNFWD